MKRLLSRRPSPALVVAVVALVVAMAGTGYAAFQLPKNSVGTKQIKKNAVNGAKVKNKSLTGKDINLNKLGTVPSANLANGFSSTEGIHLVGAPGEPPFLDGSSNVPPEIGFSFAPVGFFKDHDGVVHLEGFAIAGEKGTPPGEVFQLPPGFRPASGVTQVFSLEGEPVFVFGSNVNISGFTLDGIVYAPEGVGLLSGITFKAQS
jgi:hypothetical protein